MALWNIEQLKRWWAPKEDKGDDTEPKGNDSPWDDDPSDDDNDGEGDDPSDGGEGEGEGGNPAPEGDEPEGDEPGSTPGGKGDDDEPGEEPGGEGQGKGGAKPLDPNDYAALDSITGDQIRDPNLTVENEAGEASTPITSTPPVFIANPVEMPVGSVEAGNGASSVVAWNRDLKAIRGVAGLRLSLRRLMQKSDSAGRESGLRAGRLSGRGVSRLLNGSENVFERRYEVEGENVAVSLLIDRSGSMQGSKMRAAATVALLIGETANNAGAKVEVVAFDSAYDRETRDAMQGAMTADTGRHYGNDGSAGSTGSWLYADPSAVYVCKGFAQPIGHLRRMYTAMKSMAQGGTNDASAVQWAGQRLLKQQVNRRILFVIADGEGDNDAVFLHTVRALEAQGVIVIGIGINCVDRHFCRRFTYATTISDPADLCGKAFGMLIATITKAKRLAA